MLLGVSAIISYHQLVHEKGWWDVDGGRVAKCHGHMYEGCPHLGAVCSNARQRAAWGVRHHQLQSYCIGRKGGMWIEGECLSGMATLMRVILILLLYMFVGEQ